MKRADAVSWLHGGILCSAVLKVRCNRYNRAESSWSKCIFNLVYFPTMTACYRIPCLCIHTAFVVMWNIEAETGWRSASVCQEGPAHVSR